MKIEEEERDEIIIEKKSGEKLNVRDRNKIKNKKKTDQLNVRDRIKIEK